jgi:hypothetical protein
MRTLGVLEEVVAAGATWQGVKVHDKLGNLDRWKCCYSLRRGTAAVC